MQEETLNKIKRRVNEFEAKEPIIQALGNSQIQIQLPGQKDPDRAKDLIMRAAYLEFYMLAGMDKTLDVMRAVDQHFDNKFAPRVRRPGLGEVQPFEVPLTEIDVVREMIEEAEATPGVIPEGVRLALGREPKPWAEKQCYFMYILDAPAAMSGEGLRYAVPRPDEQRGGDRWRILFQFDAISSRTFGEVTAANVGRNMAMVVDNVVESAPRINEAIYGSGEITGDFEPYEARDLAIALNSGSMDVPITEDMTGVVGPGLGADSIRKGVVSAIVGLIIVMAFMAFYYRAAGIVANLALASNALLVVGALAYFDATLTLPGIAGMILTIGMAVDANVLIFERIREEIRNGRSLLASIDTGFARATVTILDANVTTLIAAAVLWEFGTGPIKGFAETLMIGVCSSVFAALIVSRALFDFLADRNWLAKLGMMSFLKDETHIKFLDRRKMAFILSGSVILLGLVVFAARGSDNLGVDFRTGTNMIVNLKTDAELTEEEVRVALAEAGFEDAGVVAYERTDADTRNQFLIRISEATLGGVAQKTGTPEEDGAPATDFTVSGRVEDTLASLCDEVVTEKIDTVGPAVGKRLKWDALLSISVALMFIIAYLWFRFELKFAVGAVVALLHDVLITVGLFALTDRELSLPVVAALLTIIGYSLNDTIVVFDRVREDLRLYRGRGMTYAEVMDISINQTLSRTILTSVTTLFVVVVLFLFGGQVINDFAFALMAGVVVGTYSSIFVASPVVYFWQKLQGKHTLPHRGGGESGSTSSRRKKKKEKKAEQAEEAPA